MFHLFVFLQNYPLLLRIVRGGGRRGLAECQQQFKNEIWNCSLVNKNVYQQLPIFVKTTLPYGEFKLSFFDSVCINLIPSGSGKILKVEM